MSLEREVGLTVTAEGVESEARAEILVAARCNQLQGSFFGMPEETLSLTLSQVRLAG